MGLIAQRGSMDAFKMLRINRNQHSEVTNFSVFA